jgi:hypothetical protein
MMRIGVDFDNTIVCCDPLFHRAATAKKLIPAGVGSAKSAVRDYLRAQNQEPAWTELQGTVYGDLLREAQPFPGVLDFFVTCARQKVPVAIVSHKTKRPFLGEPYDLHAAALNWITSNHFFEAGLPRSSVYLELTKEDKLRRIAAFGCTHFIDDLPEFLRESAFPAGVERVLFDPNHQAGFNGELPSFSSWSQINDTLLKK